MSSSSRIPKGMFGQQAYRKWNKEDKSNSQKNVMRWKCAVFFEGPPLQERSSCNLVIHDNVNAMAR